MVTATESGGSLQLLFMEINNMFLIAFIVAQPGISV